ncbi:LOW QUALITY PROTEIN: protein TIPIN homolog [Ooceraea biroi]|uniref:LOW QUALITY PROTEIN: protein TIPIN homolog n=1 Tax=Ooceraea biroi TaxID=2015173 RepID=UPI000F087637|nr:LOW QUALITY PROTEIN: protein TIPIN homolog [Ooceraea biroi]
MANTLDYEGDDNIIAHYENEESDGERRSLGEAEEATSDNETGTARRIDPSTATRTHVIRNPAPKLNTERLKGPNGIQIIEKYFEAFKFYGKGHEKTDLDRIMKRLEHWSYRLFPKYHFDDFLARAEQLGAKKDLRDILLAQSDNVPSSQIVCPSSTKTQVSDDMKKKIKRNKQLAIQRRLERQKEREEEIKRRKLLENTNMDIPNENDNSTAHGGTDASQVDDTHSQIDETTSKIV